MNERKIKGKSETILTNLKRAISRKSVNQTREYTTA